MVGKAYRYLKWADDVIGVVHDDLSVSFVQSEFNPTVSLYTHGAHSWSPSEFLDFLSERIVSPQRRDIEKLLFRCGLSEYDTFKIADATHAVNPKDELWMSAGADGRLQDATTDVFESVFLHRIDADGDSVNTPEGFNVTCRCRLPRSPCRSGTRTTHDTIRAEARNKRIGWRQ